jgi:hypothetical protein
MVRVPRGWPPMARPAGSQPARAGAAARRVPVPRQGLYVRLVTVDLGNDGVAPTVTFPASGVVTAFCGPNVAGESWALDQCFLSTSVGLLDPAQCTVYVGPFGCAGVPQYAVTASLGGGGSQFGMGGVGVPFGWFVFAVWTGGTAGAIANLRVTGTKTALAM